MCSFDFSAHMFLQLRYKFPEILASGYNLYFCSSKLENNPDREYECEVVARKSHEYREQIVANLNR